MPVCRHLHHAGNPWRSARRDVRPNLVYPRRSSASSTGRFGFCLSLLLLMVLGVLVLIYIRYLGMGATGEGLG